METIEVGIVNKSNNELPSYANPGDAGCDVRAYLSEPVVIPSHSRALIKTGLFLEIPLGYEIQVRPRSGLALKYGITVGCDPEVLDKLMSLDPEKLEPSDYMTVLNNPGTIDSYYRGELGVVLYNTGDTEYTVNSGDKIAQLVVAEVKHLEWKQKDDLDLSNDRGGGWGSTGKQ